MRVGPQALRLPGDEVVAPQQRQPPAQGGLGRIPLRTECPQGGVIVLPDQIAVARAHEAFGPDESLLNPRQQVGIEGLGKTLASFLAKVKA